MRALRRPLGPADMRPDAAEVPPEGRSARREAGRECAAACVAVAVGGSAPEVRAGAPHAAGQRRREPPLARLAVQRLWPLRLEPLLSAVGAAGAAL